LVETEKSVYVKVVDKQALSKVVVVWLNDGRGLKSKPTHQRIQSSNWRFEKGRCVVCRQKQGIDAIKFTLNFSYV
jgi:hypothetical protein